MGSAGPSSFGELLKRYRTAARLTQEELAERAGLSTRGIQDLERGLRRSPHPDTARRLTGALGLADAERAELLGALDRAGSAVGSANAIHPVSVPPRAPSPAAPTRPLPTGTVTFLFTDVEGSSRSWEARPGAMRVALARHDELIEALVERHEGVLVRPRGEGDSRFAVFGRASDAVAAALAIQRALQAEAWTGELTLRVRIAVHTGEADLREDDYYGSAVNRCARLRGIAHGGQALLSQATCDLARASLPPEAGLLDLGWHRLEDLAEPEHVYQLTHSELPADFPPLRSINARLQNLPIQLTSFVGREKELAEIHRLLTSSRLITLTGPGGVGKTRLAIAVAEAVLPDYADGVWLVELAPLSDPALVPSAVAATLGVRESARPLVEQLAEAARSKAMLIVLDNCEHVVHACAELSERLLRVARQIQILATSRQPLGAQGEVIWRVPGLALPRAAVKSTQMGTLETEAVRLFVERAVAVSPGFRLTEHSGAVIEVCRQLDGNPLAIELAAARVRILTPDQIAARMGDRFRILASGPRTAPRRQQTLRTAVDWSYGLLSQPEQTLFNRLSVFAGGWTLETAEVVCADPEQPAQAAKVEVLDLIGRLVDQSLVEAESGESATRFRLSETLRQYAYERLRESGEEEALRSRHLDWCLMMGDSFRSGEGVNMEELWLARMDREHDNMRAALAWALENRSDPVPSLRLAGDMYYFWWRRGHLSEGRAWLARALELDAQVGTTASLAGRRARVRTLRGAGVLARTQSDYAEADSMFSASVALARELDDVGSIAHGLSWLASDALVLGEEAQALAFAEESVAMYRRLADAEGQARVSRPLDTLANLAWRRGDSERARAIHEERLRFARDAGDQWLTASVSVSLGEIASEQGEHNRAKELLDASRESFSTVGDRIGMAWAISHLGRAARARGDTAEAEAQFRESLRMYRELGALWGIAECLDDLAAVAGDLGQSERAAKLFGSAAALRETVGVRLAGRNVTKQEREMDPIRAALGPNRFEAAWRIGRELPLSEAIDAALRTEPRRPSA